MNGQISSIDDVVDIVQSNTRLRATGKGTKSALSASIEGVTELNLSTLTGIIEYQPDEYTFTAYAGTPVKDIAATLAQHGQYLPCDPLLAERGATLGGTVASNTSGSRRYRYGGVRDFILGATVVDGSGRTIRGGGKVVKNSAGFDLAKFFVGSLGLYGVLVELTFKVFPEPKTFSTVRLHYASLSSAIKALFYLNAQPFDIDSLDLEPSDQRWTLLVRFGGGADTMSSRIQHFRAVMEKATPPASSDDILDDSALWAGMNACAWARDYANLVKVPITPRQIPDFDAQVQAQNMSRRYAVGGNVAWVASSDIAPLTAILKRSGLVGLHIIGQSQSPVLGDLPGQSLARRMKKVFDPSEKFL